MESNEPTSVVVIPESNKFIVHCESTLFSYSLELAIRISQGDAASLDNEEGRLTEEHEKVLFVKAGHIADRTSSKQMNQILTRFPIAQPQSSCLCIEEFQEKESIIARIRVDPAGTGLPSGSQIVIPAFGFGSSPHMPSERFSH